MEEQNLDSDVRTNLTEHEFIAQYTEALAKSLSVWDNGSQDYEYYKKLAWAGLESSDAYKAKNNIVKVGIQNAIQAEQTANSKSKGSKCN